MKSQGPSCERSRPTNVWMKSVTLARTAGMVWLGWLCFRSTAAIQLMVRVRVADLGPGGVGPSNDGYPIGNHLFHDAIQHKPPNQTTNLPLAEPWLQKEGELHFWRDAEWSFDDTVVWAKCCREKITFEL